MLLNLLYKLDAADRHGRVIEPFESEHRSGSLFDSPVVLLNHIFLRYLLDRARTRLGSRPSAFSSRTARCDAA